MLNVRRIPFFVGNNYIYKCHCPGHKRKRKGSCFRLLLYSQWVTTVFDLAELLPQMPFLTQPQWDLCLLPGDKKAKFGKKNNVLSLQLQHNQSGLITPYFSHPFIHFLNRFHGCGGLKLDPAVTRQEAEYTLERSHQSCLNSLWH